MTEKSISFKLVKPLKIYSGISLIIFYTININIQYINAVFICCSFGYITSITQVFYSFLVKVFNIMNNRYSTLSNVYIIYNYQKRKLSFFSIKENKFIWKQYFFKSISYFNSLINFVITVKKNPIYPRYDLTRVLCTLN